jgi:hypothetical protein
MHSARRAGGILIRGTSQNGFQLIDMPTGEYIAGPFQFLPVALAAARARRPRAIWQQSVDHRGRPLGEPYRLPQPPLSDRARSA